MVASVHDGEDVVVVVLIDQLDQCSRTQVEVVDGLLVVMNLLVARVDDRCWEEL